ncbi:MAG: type II toxin-antitoxin system RelB/DinJ family antitoxin [Ruminococcus sp.]|nr:type II toxin-antitoxin system RelB/DinJ family antitoxin [Ruminococcus sp.]
MPQTTVSFRIDSDLKTGLEKTCEELGMSMTTAFTVFAKKVTREKRIPFDISIDRFYSESNTEAIEKSFNQYKEGKVVIKTMDELEAMENE